MDSTVLGALVEALKASPGILAAVFIVVIFTRHLDKSDVRNHDTLRRFADAQKTYGESQGQLAQQIARQDEVIRRCTGGRGGT